MSLEGELTVDVAWDGARVRQVSMRSTRRFLVQRLVAGMPAAEAVAVVPRLFSVCRQAQGAAAAGAIAAGASDRDGSDTSRHRVPVLLETVQEYVSRVLIDWPRAMGREPSVAPVAAVRQRIDAFLRSPGAGAERHDATALRELVAALGDAVARSVYGMSPTAWLSRTDFDELQRWGAGGATLPATMLDALLREAPALGASDVAQMPPLDREALTSIVVPALARDAHFARAPTWAGAPVETGALARTLAHPLVAATMARVGNGVVTRMLARLVELALLLSRDLATDDGAATPSPVQGFPLGAGEGLAAVQTARGLLMHRARVARGGIAEYQIVAPTEWNFHPDGALARGLRGIEAGDEDALARQARLAVQALDPCIACRIEVHRA